MRARRLFGDRPRPAAASLFASAHRSRRKTLRCGGSELRRNGWNFIERRGGRNEVALVVVGNAEHLANRVIVGRIQ